MAEPNPFKIAGVLGWPVAHSRSPMIHGHWLETHGISGSYMPLPVRPDDVHGVIRALPSLGFAGVNVTVPHKEAALAAADDADDLARRIGAANTLVVKDGLIHATNTDAYGFMANLHEGLPDFDVTSGPALVLGAGGAARAILVGLLDAGVPRIVVANRTRARAEHLVGALRDSRLGVIDWSARGDVLESISLLINTTSLGMAGHDPLDMPLDNLKAGTVVTDIVYAPLETGLLAAARARGNFTIDGLGMLLHQAVPGFEAWFGVRPTVTDALRDLVLEDLG